MRIFYRNTTKKKSSRFITGVPRNLNFCERKKTIVFCNFLEIKAEIKKVVGVKVVPFRVLYSCVKFQRLKMGDPVYHICMVIPRIAHHIYVY